MENTQNLSTSRLADAWAELQAHADSGTPLQADAYRLAFADPEFLLRRETRGLRMQLEMLKPDVEQQRLGIESTIVVFGSARFVSAEQAQRDLQQALAGGMQAERERAERQLRNSVYYEQARQFARLVARHSKACTPEQQIFICTGGGPGIMEAANRGAFDVGCKSIGLNIKLPAEQQPNPFITPELCFQFKYFALRKFHFILRAAAVVLFPGGFGTLDEMFETLTLRQTHRMQPVPIILFGRDYWSKVIDFQHLADTGVIADHHLDLFTYAETPAEAWQQILDFHARARTAQA
jgi:uncharacterized protein (TIGR00730 family)